MKNGLLLNSYERITRITNQITYEEIFLNLPSEIFVSVINVYEEEKRANEFINSVLQYHSKIYPEQFSRIESQTAVVIDSFIHDTKVMLDSANPFFKFFTDIFTVVFILDDSSSMNGAGLSPDVSSKTKWEELKNTFKLMLEVFPIIGDTELYFVNKWYSGLRNLSNEQITSYLDEMPLGMSSIDHTFKQVLSNNKSREQNGKKLLIFALTDGEITNHEGLEDLDIWNQILTSLPSDVFTTILNISDDKRTYEFLNKVCSNSANVTSDHLSSIRDNIQQSKNDNFQIKFSDYLSKLLAKFNKI